MIDNFQNSIAGKKFHVLRGGKRLNNNNKNPQKTKKQKKSPKHFIMKANCLCIFLKNVKVIIFNSTAYLYVKTVCVSLLKRKGVKDASVGKDMYISTH